MATYYYDSVQGTAGGSGSRESPKDALPKASGWEAGSTYLVKDGTTQTLTSTFYFGPNAAGVILGSYTDSQDFSGQGILNGGTSTATYVVNISAANVTVRGLKIISNGGKQVGIRVGVDGSNVGYANSAIYDNEITCETNVYVPGISCSGYPALIRNNTITNFYNGISMFFTADVGVRWETNGYRILDNTIIDRLPTTNLTTSASKTSTYTILSSESGTIFYCDGTWTLNLPAASELSAGFHFRVENTGSGTITLDGNGTETIEGFTTWACGAGRSDTIWWNGSTSGNCWIAASASNGINNSTNGATAPINLNNLSEIAFNNISGFGAAGINLNPTQNNKAHNNIIHDDAAIVDYVRGVMCGSQATTGGGVNNKVYNNIIYHLVGYGAYTQAATGIETRCGYEAGNQNLQIYGNLIYDIEGPGIMNNGPNGASSGKANLFRFNTIQSNTDYGIVISCGVNHVITSNIIVTTSSFEPIYIGTGYTATHTKNVEYGKSGYAGSGTLTDGGGNLTTDPQLNSSFFITNESQKKTSDWIAGITALDGIVLPISPDPGAVQDRSASGRRSGPGGTL